MEVDYEKCWNVWIERVRRVFSAAVLTAHSSLVAVAA